jgi:hypothetical protein
MPQLAIILLNYNHPGDTLECIQSLGLSTYRDFTIYVVDNASLDGSVASMRSRRPEITLIENKENFGFPEGNNIGIRLALREQHHMVLLLNNDTVVEPTTIAELVAAKTRHPDWGIVGAKILYYDNPGTLWFSGGRLNPDSARGQNMGIGSPDDNSSDADQTADFVTGCCMLITRETIEKIGYLDPDYFAYYEDSDYCLRAQRAGFGVGYTPRSRVLHKVSTTNVLDGPTYIYFTLRNRIIFLRKHTPFVRIIPHLPELGYFYVRHFIRLTVKKHKPNTLKAAWWGFVDGLTGRTGSFGRGRADQLD